MIAFVLTSLVFVGAFLVINIDAKQSAIPSRYRASVIQLGDMDDELRWWIERNSPDLPEWMYSTGESSDQAVNILLEESLRNGERSVNLYQDIKFKKIDFEDKDVYTLNNQQWLPPVPSFSTGEVEALSARPQSIEFSVVASADKALQHRLAYPVRYGGLLSEKWNGRSVRLIVAVDAEGNVLSVNPAEWEQDEMVKELVNWAYTLPFLPNKKDNKILVGVLNLESVTNVDRKTRKEIQP